MVTMINEKTGVFIQSKFVINGERFYLGAVFESQIDFAKKTVRKSIKSINVYRWSEQRFRRVSAEFENAVLRPQPYRFIVQQFEQWANEKRM